MNQQDNTLWELVKGSGPVIATAIHDGHELRPEASKRLKLSEADQLREEDPHTGHLAAVADNYIIAHRSRFEVDLNRPRDRAVYRTPEDAWGLDLWHEPPTEAFVSESLAIYDEFYETAAEVFSSLADDFGAFVVFDVHSYNHKRLGPDGPAAEPAENPEVNVGTGTLDRDRWAPVIDRFIDDLASFNLGGRKLDVRENVKFRGGNLAKETHQRFPESGCVLAVEFRKSFMDEWTGEVHGGQLELLRLALGSTLTGVIEEVLPIGAANKRKLGKKT